jgi:hypothetical protein
MSINQICSNGNSNRFLPAVALNDLSCVTTNTGTETVGTLNSSTINNTGFANFGNGTVAAPSIRWLTAGDTGLYRPITKSVGVVAGGTERIRTDNVRNTLLMPTRVANNLTSPAQYMDFTNVGADTQLKLIGNSNIYINFENPQSDVDLQIGLSSTQNAYIKSKTNISVQDETGSTSVEISKNKTGIKLYNNIVGYTPSSLDYYEEYKSPNVTVSGGTAPLSLSGVVFTRVGKVVSMLLPEISVIGTNAPLSIANLVPTRFLPSSTCNFYVTAFDTIAVPNPPHQTNGHCDINSTTGTATFYRTPNHASFNNTASVGIRTIYLSWLTV